ncbi:hypothetical protein DCAR_0102346 [Daucus carota subsp. sativus]|uniref:Uncharacterized protein n=1 Tax=Daucus carota subsp. sativus TaxID=79200 RepID=A0A166H1K6_DAUCS|nr:hypothetical protein DCAR_0102346 [Daucus carota subsp. sativus]
MEARGTSQIQRSWNPEEAPNVKGYGLDDGKQKLDALNYYSCNNSRNAIIANRGVHSGGSGRVEMAQVIDQDHDNTMENYVANIRAQFKVVPRRFGLGAMEVPPEILESGHLSSGLQTLYHEPAGATEDALNQENAGDTAIAMYDLGNPVNMDSRSFGEGTSANQVLDDLPSEEEVNNMIQDLEAYDLFDWIN